MNVEAQPPAKRPGALKERLKVLMAEYGMLAIIVFIAISAAVYAGAYAAMAFGWKPESTAGTVGTAGAAYVAYRFTLPFRVAAAVLLTPLIARVLVRMGVRRPRPPA